MADLGELLVLMHGARDRVQTVRAVLRTWRHEARAREAFTRTGGAVLYAAAAGDEPEVAEAQIRVWFAADRAREEREDPHGASVAVRRGALWWRYDPHNGAMSNADEPDVGGSVGDDLWWLRDPAPVIGALDFHDLAPGRCAGRSTIRARAVPRAVAEGDDWPLIRLGAHGVDDLVLDVDSERGALLRVETRLHGDPVSVVEALEIGFDERFDDDTFVFTPPPGEELRGVRDRFAVHHDLTIEQAVAAAPFAVWAPARLPPRWETEIHFAAESDRPPIAPQLHIHCRAPDGLHGFSMSQSPAGHPGDHDDYEHARANPWRAVERAGRRMEVREPAEGWQPAQVRLELEGTRILIHSGDLDAGSLADLAAALQRAPETPPAF